MKTILQATVESFAVPDAARVTFGEVKTKGPFAQAPAGEGVQFPQKPYTPPLVVMAPLDLLDSLTLAKMCDDFCDEVFKKAGKEKPPEPEMPTLRPSSLDFGITLVRQAMEMLGENPIGEVRAKLLSAINELKKV